jgi:hypothetical protein
VENKGVGSTEKKVENDRYHYDQGEEKNPMGWVSNNGAGKTQTLFLSFFFFYSCGVIL